MLSYCESNSRKYAVQFIGVLTLYAIFIVASVFCLQRINVRAPWKYLIAGAPFFPALLLLLVIVRVIRELDELQRKIQFEAIAFSFSAVAVISFGYGLLENAGMPPLNLIWICPLMTICWSSSVWFARRRYQ